MEDMSAAYYNHHHYHPPPPPTSQYGYYPPPPPVPGVPPPSHHLPPPSQNHLPPLPYSSHYPLPPYQQQPSDEVRTLFIAGLPDDIKHREVYNLFREFPGYQSCQLRTSGQSDKAYGFAVFLDQQSAVAAMQALNGMVFDLERESTLHIDLAKSNSRFKRLRTDDEMPYSSDRTGRGSVAHSRGFPDSGVGSNMHMPGMGNSAYSTNGYPSAQSYTNYGYEAAKDVDPSKLNSSSTPYVPQNNTPCATIFVANLGPTCYEHELIQAFSRCPGFVKLKMQNKNGVPVAFVDFQASPLPDNENAKCIRMEPLFGWRTPQTQKDVACSTGALNHLQGAVLYSSVGDGMRLEYAKSRMGLRKREKKT